MDVEKLSVVELVDSSGDPSSATFARLERIEHYLIERFNKIEEDTE